MSNMVVATNTLALNSHRNLKTVGAKQSQASARLSSGYKINSAADDAAGLAISEKMRAQIRGLDMASKNAQDGTSLIQTAEGGMQEIDNMLQRIRELVDQAANDTNEYNTQGTSDRQKIQDEINQLTQEIDKMADRVEFNNKKVIDGTYADVTKQIDEAKKALQLAMQSAPASNGLSISQINALKNSLTVWQNSVNTVKTALTTQETQLTNLGLSMNDRTVSYNSRVKSLAAAQTALSKAEERFNKASVGAKSLYAASMAVFQASITSHEASITAYNNSVLVNTANKAIKQASIAVKQASLDERTSEVSRITAAIKGGSDTESNMLKVDAIKTQIQGLEKLNAANGGGVPLYFQVGANSFQGIEVNVGSAKTDILGIGDGEGNSKINVVKDTGAKITGYLDVMDNALSYITTERSKLGATQNRLDYTMKSLDISSENLSAAESRIRDTDMAKEMMKLTQANILQQASTSMLAQANQAPQSVLQLLG